jgi:hypothetical protein
VNIVTFAESEALLRTSPDMCNYQTAWTQRAVNIVLHAAKTPDAFDIETLREKAASAKSATAAGFYPEYDFRLSSMPDLVPLVTTISTISQSR